MVPPGWPAEVRPPGAPDWVRSAVAWLLDLCPPDYRAHTVLTRHPLVLARFASWHVEAAAGAARHGLSRIRVELGGLVTPETRDAAVVALEREGARLAAAGRAVVLVERALRGEEYVPRM